MLDDPRSGTSVHRQILVDRCRRDGLVHAVSPRAPGKIPFTFCGKWAWVKEDDCSDISCVQCIALMGAYR